MPVVVPPRTKPKVMDVDLKKIDKIMGKLKQADVNRDGCYSKDELKNALKGLGAILPGWRANRCLGKADTDNDGQISGDEIDTLIEYLINHGFGNK